MKRFILNGVAAALFLNASCAVPGGTNGQYVPDNAFLIGPSFQRSLSTNWEEDSAQWWTRFGDATVNALVVQALEHNQDLKIAAANVLAAQAGVRAAAGGRGMSLDVGIDGSRGFVTPTVDSNRQYTTTLTPNARIAWQADLFGRLKNQERSAIATALATESDQLALTHSLIAAMIRQRVAVSVLQRRIALAESIVRSREVTSGSVQGRYERGVSNTNAVDVRLARENLAAAKAALPSLFLQKQQTEHLLQELLGQRPGTLFTLPLIQPLPNIPAPPVGLPAGLLDRRPDLLAAQFRAQASAANVDVALAALYPDLVVSANGGWNRSKFKDLFDPERLFGNLVADLSVRLFGSGQLDAAIEIAEAQLQASAANYQALTLNALREVEDALVAETQLREQLVRTQEQVEEAQIAETLARDRYALGVGNLLTVLDTERRRANGQDFALRLQQEIWNTRVDLHLALGGNWDVRDTGNPNSQRSNVPTQPTTETPR